MHCDVIIPTYNNAGVLPLTMQALAAQQLPDGWSVRVVISDDGSTDGTWSFVQTLQLPAPWQVQLITGVHTGSAGARNRALAKVDGTIIFFLGADIILRPGALAAHLTFHQRHPEAAAAALGFIDWDPHLSPSPLMVWLTHGGPQNNYDALLGTRLAAASRFFYGSHLSLKRECLRTERFAPEFTRYGWEDIELGRRLETAGVRLYVLHEALAWHHHRYNVRAICRRQFLVGQSLVTYQRLHPEVRLIRQRAWWRHALDGVRITSGVPLVLAWLASAAESWALPRLYERLTGVYFWWGVYSSKSKSVLLKPKKY